MFVVSCIYRVKSFLLDLIPVNAKAAWYLRVVKIKKENKHVKNQIKKIRC